MRQTHFQGTSVEHEVKEVNITLCLVYHAHFFFLLMGNLPKLYANKVISLLCTSLCIFTVLMDKRTPEIVVQTKKKKKNFNKESL